MNKKVILGIGIVAGLAIAKVWRTKKKSVKKAIKTGITKTTDIFKEEPEVEETNTTGPNEYGFVECDDNDILSTQGTEEPVDDNYELVDLFIIHNADGSKSLADDRQRERLYGNYWPYTYAEMLSGLDISDGIKYKSEKFEVIFSIHNMPVEE